MKKEEAKPKKEDVAVDDSEYYGKIRLDDDEMLETDAERVIVSMRNIHKTYLLGVEGVPALRGVTATIYKGEFVSSSVLLVVVKQQCLTLLVRLIDQPRVISSFVERTLLLGLRIRFFQSFVLPRWVSCSRPLTFSLQ